MIKRIISNESMKNWKLFYHNKLALIGLLILMFILFVSVMAPVLPLKSPEITDPARRLYLPLVDGYWLGSDHLGRDILSRLIWGARVSLSIGILASIIAAFFGTVVGLIAGYAGEKIDGFLMRMIDMIMAFPHILLALAIVAVLGPGLMNVLYAIAVVNIPFFARNIRGVTLTVKNKGFIEAARLSGKTHLSILLGEVFPNVLPTLVVGISTTVGWMILETAGLSFLGLGAQPPASDLGSMLGDGRKLLFTAPHVSVIPGLMIFFLVMGINLVGDGIRDVLDPRLKSGLFFRPLPRTIDKRKTMQCPEGHYDSLLVVKNLSVKFYMNNDIYHAVTDLSFDISPGECLGIIGESGSGKSVTALSLMGLVASPPAVISEGSIYFKNRDLLSASNEEIRSLRGSKIAYVFQDPQMSLHPLMTIGHQIVEAIQAHQSISYHKAWSKAVDLLDIVQIPNASRRVHAYPHQLSGGMRQRVVIAMALANEVELLVADEPTTALDVTVQSQIIHLLKVLQKDHNLAIIFITHDFSIIAELCTKVAVMYAGKIVEKGSIDLLLHNPAHPYTKKLIGCVPKMGHHRKSFEVIEGIAPMTNSLPQGCAFADRCEFSDTRCRKNEIVLDKVSKNHYVRCLKPLKS